LDNFADEVKINEDVQDVFFGLPDEEVKMYSNILVISFCIDPICNDYIHVIGNGVSK